MTVSSTSNRVVYQGNGSTTVFPFAFKVNQAADLVVIYTDATGTDYTLSPGQYAASGFGLDAGGSVTYAPNGSAIASGTSLTIYRSVAPTQPTSISNQGAMWPQVIEGALDRGVMIAQGLLDLAGRALQISPSDGGALQPLPNASTRANAYLAFDENGQPTAVKNLSLASVSSWIATNFLPQTTAAAACSALGAQAALGFTPLNQASNLSDVSSVSTARSNLDVRVAVADTNPVVAATAFYHGFTSISAARVCSLPSASTVKPGHVWTVVDESGSASSTNTISVAPNGTDTIDGSNTTQVAINLPRGSAVFVCDGASKWIPLKWSVVYSNVLGGNVSLTQNVYGVGPRVAQGTVGRWRAYGQFVVVDSGAEAYVNFKLWDGTSVVSSGQCNTRSAGVPSFVHVSGISSAPSGDLRIGVQDVSTGSGAILANNSGNSKDSCLVVERLP